MVDYNLDSLRCLFCISKTDLETDSFTFTYEGDEDSFILRSNEQWSVDDVPQWITVNVTDALVATRAEGTLYDRILIRIGFIFIYSQRRIR